MTKLFKMLGAFLFCLVACAGANAKTASSSMKKHSTGAVHIAKAGTAGRTLHVVATSKLAGRKRGRGARAKLAVRRGRCHETFFASSLGHNLTLGPGSEGRAPVGRAAALEAPGDMKRRAVQ